MNVQDRFRSILIFGGAGFIGSNWAHRLLEKTEAKIHIFDNLSRPGVRNNLESLQVAAGGSGRLKITVGDVRDAEKVERAVRFATEIYHFAAQVAVTKSLIDPRFDFEVNLQGTLNILEAARKSGARPFLLFTSTNKVYGNLANLPVVKNETHYNFADIEGISESQPLDVHSPYGCSKGGAEQYVRDYARVYGLPTVVFRMSCIAGPRQYGTEDQGWVAHFLYSALRGVPLVIYGDGRQVRDVLCIHDLVRAFEAVRCNTSTSAGEIYNVGGGPRNAVSLLELIEKVERLTHRQVEFVCKERRPADQLIYVTNYSKLASHTGWQPETDIDTTLELIYAWWRRNRELLEPSVSSSRSGESIPLLQRESRLAPVAVEERAAS